MNNNMMNNNSNNETGLYSEEDNYYALSTPLLQNVNDNAAGNLTTETSENQTNCSNSFDQACNDVADFWRGTGYGEYNQIEHSVEECVDSSTDPSANNIKSQTTEVHDNNFSVEYSNEKNNHHIEPMHSNQLNEIPQNFMMALRQRECALVMQGIPRFMVLRNYCFNCYINCILHLLLNSPVFIRFIDLYNASSFNDEFNDSQVIEYNNIHLQKEVYIMLCNIVNEAQIPYQNDEVDLRVLKDLCNKFKLLYPDMGNYVQRDADEFLIRLLEVIRAIADLKDQRRSYSNSFEITSTITTSDNETKVEVEHAVCVSPDEPNLEQYINQNYVGLLTGSNNSNNNITCRIYHKLPDQLIVTLERHKDGSAIFYPFPIEFTTQDGQQYTFIGAVIHDAASLDRGHYITFVRRENHVSIYDDDVITDCFNVDELPNYFNKFHVRIAMYIKLNSLYQQIRPFTDPLRDINIVQQKPTNLNSSTTNKVAKQNSTQELAASEVNYEIYIKRPICDMFRVRMDREYTLGDMNPENRMLSDCLNNTHLSFGPKSAFTTAQLGAALIFIGPEGRFHLAPFGFVRGSRPNIKTENPTIFDLEKDAITDGDYFLFNTSICKLNNQILQSNKDEPNGTCHITDFLSGEVLKIDRELFQSLEKDGNREGKKKKRTKNVTPTKLAKLLNIYTIHFILFSTYNDPDAKESKLKRKILFCSNAFNPVTYSVSQAQYDYSPNKLKITEATLSRISTPSDVNQYILKVSYIIPEFYKCTQLINKRLRVKIITTSEKQPTIHPKYKIIDEKKPVDLKFIQVDQYISTLTLNLVRLTTNQWQNDIMPNQCSSVSSSNSTSVRVATFDIASLDGFRVQLQLYDCYNGEDVPYPKSVVVSDILIAEPDASEEHVHHPTLVNDNIIDDSTDQSSLHIKRINEKQLNMPTGSPPSKSRKQT